MLPGVASVLLVALPALLAGGCGNVHYVGVRDGRPVDAAPPGDRAVEAPPADLPPSIDAPDPPCEGPAVKDDGEPNNSCAANKPSYELSTDKTLVLRGTLYPRGDEDWFKIEVKEASSGCGPWPLEQCLSIQGSLASPAVGGLQYKFTMYRDGCSPDKVTKTVSGTKSATLHWDGWCGLSDDKDVWIKVEPAAGSQPSCSGRDYQLTLVGGNENEGC